MRTWRSIRSSSGVQAAIQSALAAGPIVNTQLAPAEDGAASLEFWRGRRASRMLHHRGWAQQLYSEAFARHPSLGQAMPAGTARGRSCTSVFSTRRVCCGRSSCTFAPAGKRSRASEGDTDGLVNFGASERGSYSRGLGALGEASRKSHAK
jgi:hypothetical protein